MQRIGEHLLKTLRIEFLKQNPQATYYEWCLYLEKAIFYMSDENFKAKTTLEEEC